MNFGKPIETSTCLQIGLALPSVRTQRGGTGRAIMRNTTAGGGGGGALVQTTPTKEMGNPRGRGGAVTGGRSLTNTRQRVVRGIGHEVEGEEETEAGAAGARATGAAAVATGAGAAAGAAAGAGAGACPDPGVVVGGGHGAKK